MIIWGLDTLFLGLIQSLNILPEWGLSIRSKNQSVDLIWMIFFGVVGDLMRKLGDEGVSFIVAFVLSPMVEGALHQCLLMPGGTFMIFVNCPISGIT